MALVRDLVCGREVDTEAVDRPVGQVVSGAPETDPTPGTKRYHEGTWYYFHNLECRMRFMASPGEYLDA
jgi:YHS domain-containing protein